MELRVVVTASYKFKWHPVYHSRGPKTSADVNNCFCGAKEGGKESVAGAADGGLGSKIGALVKNGRHWLEGWRFLLRNRAAAAAETATRTLGQTSFGGGGGGSGTGRANVFVKRLLSWVSEGPAAKLRRDAATRLLFGGTGSAKVPILAFVGVTLAASDSDRISGMLTERDKLETVCEDIRICIGATFGRDEDEGRAAVVTFERYEISLKDLQLGGVIAKGCNAIVHSARLKTDAVSSAPRVRSDSEGSSDSGTESSVEVLASEDESQDTFNMTEYPNPIATSIKETPISISDLCKPFDGYDLALKMMFNYEAESNAPAILKAMHKEIVPARNTDTHAELFCDIRFDRKKRLPPHSNIVDMKWLFADSVPHLPQAMLLYPDALPKRLNRNGAGRNMTLFLVMKRYHCSLQEYLKAYDPSPRTCLILLAQLLEGVVHLGRHRVAHRDLKTDNILLDLSEGPDYPHLVITDFGCCLADNELGLKLPYYTEETDRGGNSALMAPEVSCARPGPYVTIDYAKADLWAVGALAYEIFGQKNPFYRTIKGRQRLDSRTYSDQDLPDLPPKVHPVAKQLIKAILQRNPRNRPDSATAANVIEILLFGPKKLVALEDLVLGDVDIVQWLLTLAARVVIQQSVPEENQKMKRIEHQLLTNFLHRVKLCELSNAVNVFSTK